MITHQIQLHDLIPGKYYLGRGRNSNIGLWDGQYFLVICIKFNECVIKKEPYYTKSSGCFQPFLLIDEGKNVTPTGQAGWDKHYSSKLEFR